MEKNMKLVTEIMNFCDDKYMEMVDAEKFENETIRKLASNIETTISEFLDDMEDFRIEWLLLSTAKEKGEI